MSTYIRICPACKTERPLAEDLCGNEGVESPPCGFVLMDVAATLQASADTQTSPVDIQLVGTEPDTAPPSIEAKATEAINSGCPSCHQPVEAEDAICLSCGAVIGGSERPRPIEQRLDDWVLLTSLHASTGDAELFLGRRDGDEATSLVRHFQLGLEPDPNTYPILEASGAPERSAAPRYRACRGSRLRGLGAYRRANTNRDRRQFICR